MPWPIQLMAWYSCGQEFAATSPMSDVQVDRTLRLVAAHSTDKSPEFLLLTTAVIAAESNFNQAAVSPSGAVGLMQVTLIGAKEAAKQCGLLRLDGVSDSSLFITLHHSPDNVKFGTCLLKYYLDQTHGNLLHALVLYNGGYQQLTRLAQTGTLTKETSEYVLRVHSFLGRCQ